MACSINSAAKPRYVLCGSHLLARVNQLAEMLFRSRPGTHRGKLDVANVAACFRSWSNMTGSQCHQPAVVPKEDRVAKVLRGDSTDLVRNVKAFINRISYFAGGAQDIVSFSTWHFGEPGPSPCTSHLFHLL